MKTVDEIVRDSVFYQNRLNLNALVNPEFDIMGKESLALHRKDGSRESTIESLCKYFAIPNDKKDLLDAKMRQSISGGGQELRRILTLHSSSLCPLLCFFNVADLRIDDVKYHRSFFEVQNLVFPGTRPSYMDVVLLGKDDDGKSVIMFLECKFSEYLKPLVSKGISTLYLTEGSYPYDCYQAISGFSSTLNRNEKTFDFEIKGAYADGIKQVISHLSGIKNFLNCDDSYFAQLQYRDSSDPRKEVYGRKYDRVIFRELVFAFTDEKGIAALKSYQDVEEKVRDTLLSSPKTFIEGLEYQRLMTYQELFGCEENRKKNLIPAVSQYYRFDLQ